MNSSIYRITLDIHRQTTQVNLAVKKGDTARRIVATLSDGGVPYSIGEGCYAVFMGQKPDGSVLYNACSIENGQIVYDFTEQTVSAAGRMPCELRLYGSDEQLITSPRIAIIVSGTVYEDSEVESSAEFTALSKAMTDLEKLKEEELQRAFVVTVANTEDGYRADKSLQEIRRAAEQGRYCLCNLEDFLIPLVQMESSAHFAGVWHGREYRVEIAPDDVTVEATELGGSGVFTVTYTDNEDEYKRIDKTLEEICEAADKGMLVRCETGYGWAYLESWGRGVAASFSYFDFYGYTQVFIDRDGAAYLTHYDRLTKMRGIPITIDDDGNAYAECDLTNSELWHLYIGSPPEVLPYIQLYDATYDLSIYLPNVRQEEVYIDDVAAWCIRHTFSKTLQPGEGREKAVRYTVRLVSEPDDGSSDPDGEPLIEYSVEDIEDSLPIATPETLGGVQPVAKSADMTQSVGVDATGRLWTAPAEGGGNTHPDWGWRHLDTLDLSSGAVSYEIDTTGCSEIMLLVTTALNCSGGTFDWKQFPLFSLGAINVLPKTSGGATHLRYMGDGTVAIQKPRNDGDTLQMSCVVTSVADADNTLKISFATVTSGVIGVYGR